MRRFRLRRGACRQLAAGVLPPFALAACIPYTVGTTATPLRPGQSSTTMSTFVLPSIETFDSTRSLSHLGVDVEHRFGLDERSDVGIRVPSFSGLVLNYKYLITDSKGGTQMAVMPGAGFVNNGQHFHFEFTYLVSGHEPRTATSEVAGSSGRAVLQPTFVPYGGLRVMQVAPIAERAVHDRPTAGGFFGVRIGSTDFGISPEVGVFYDHSALGVRRGDLIIVPAISIHGDRLIRMLGSGRPRVVATERLPAPTTTDWPELPPVYGTPEYHPPVFAPPAQPTTSRRPATTTRPGTTPRPATTPRPTTCAGPRVKACAPAQRRPARPTKQQ